MFSLLLPTSTLIAGSAIIEESTENTKITLSDNIRIVDMGRNGGKAFLVNKKATIISPQKFKIDPEKYYVTSVRVKALNDKPSYAYLGIAPFTKEGAFITSSTVSGIAGTLTRLAASCQPGDTVIKIADGSKWKKGGKFIMAFNAKEDESDLPNFNRTGGTIKNIEHGDGVYNVTLSRPIGKTYPVGTKVREHYHCAKYLYEKWGKVPVKWTKWQSRPRKGSKFRKGAWGQLVLLCNYGSDKEQKMLFNNLKIEALNTVTSEVGFENSVFSPWKLLLPAAITSNQTEVIQGRKSLKIENSKDTVAKAFIQSETLTGKRTCQIEFDYKILEPGTDLYVKCVPEPPYKNMISYYRNINADPVRDGDFGRNFKHVQVGRYTISGDVTGKVRHKKIIYRPEQAAKRKITFFLSGKGSAVIDNLRIVQYCPENIMPSAPKALLPVAESIVSDFALDFCWTNAENAIRYELQVDKTKKFSKPLLFTIDDTGADRVYFIPGEKLSAGKYYWRIRGINEYGQYGKWSELSFFEIDTDFKEKPKIRVISPSSPQFIFYRHISPQIFLKTEKKILEDMPELLRKYSSFYFGSGDWFALVNSPEIKSLPFCFMNRLMFKFKRGKLACIPLSLQEYMYRNYKNCLGSLACEQSVWNPEVADYNMKLNKLAAKYGRNAIHDDFGPTVILNLDKEWRKNQTLYEKYAIPVAKGVFYSCDGHSSVFGWWLSHKNSVWGIQPEPWYFNESGYDKLNDPPWRHANSEKWKNCRRGYAILNAHPENLWGLFIITGMISGATVYPFELCKAKFGENVSFWHSDGSPTTTWTRVVKPLLEDIVKYKLIPKREDIEKKVKLAYVITDKDVPKSRVVGDICTESGSLQKIMDVAYGKHYWCELIPNTCRYYYVPIIFEEDVPSLPSGIKAVYSKDFKNSEEIKKYFDKYYPPVNTGDAFVARVGLVTAIMNTNENADKFENYNIRTENANIKSIRGIIGVHQYLVIKELANHQIFIHENNRKERKTTIEFECSKKPELKVVPESALVNSGWNEKNKTMTVTVSHKEGAVRLFLK
ncbi:MAG: glycosyl hydrolase family 98 C-terminal domain-containing protein [Victivallaceae bacterium]